MKPARKIFRMLSGPRKSRQVAVFISAGGSTLQSLLELQHQINISLVVSSSKKAAGLLKAKRFGKKVHHLARPLDYVQIDSLLAENKIEIIILAGFMKLLPPDFVEKWKGRIVNIHPSLLPAFPGLNSAERSWMENSDMGVTLHHVTAKMDDGPSFLQKVSLRSPKNHILPEAELFLRRSEQHLLREMVLRYF